VKKGRKPNMNKKLSVKILALLISAVAVTALAVAWLVRERTIPVNVFIEGGDLQAFYDPECTRPISAINFSMEKDSAYDFAIYLENTGTRPCQVYWYYNGPTLPAGVYVSMSYDGDSWRSMSNTTEGKRMLDSDIIQTILHVSLPQLYGNYSGFTMSFSLHFVALDDASTFGYNP
jgi:hypothetical protein